MLRSRLILFQLFVITFAINWKMLWKIEVVYVFQLRNLLLGLNLSRFLLLFFCFLVLFVFLAFLLTTPLAQFNANYSDTPIYILLTLLLSYTTQTVSIPPNPKIPNSFENCFNNPNQKISNCFKIFWLTKTAPKSFNISQLKNPKLFQNCSELFQYNTIEFFNYLICNKPIRKKFEC